MFLNFLFEKYYDVIKLTILPLASSDLYIMYRLGKLVQE